MKKVRYGQLNQDINQSDFDPKVTVGIRLLDGRWNSSEAVRLYKDAILTALQREYPHRRRFTVLEDNDPTGFKSKVGVQAKVDSNLDVFEIPKHSPQLIGLDDYLWMQ